MCEERWSAGELCRREWFQGASESSESEAHALIKATQLNLNESICPEKFRALLNQIISDSVWYQVKGLKSKDDTKRLLPLINAIIEYSEKSEELNREGDNLPVIPKRLLGQFELLQFDYSMYKTHHKNRSPSNWIPVFYPSCLALFAAAFGQKPRSTYNEDTGRTENPTILFIEHILLHVGQQQEELGFDERFACDPIKASLRWDFSSNRNTIRSQIAKHLKAKLKLPKHLPEEEVALFDLNSEQFQLPLWRTYVAGFRKQLAKEPVQE